MLVWQVFGHKPVVTLKTHCSLRKHMKIEKTQPNKNKQNNFSNLKMQQLGKTPPKKKKCNQIQRCVQVFRVTV